MRLTGYARTGQRAGSSKARASCCCATRRTLRAQKIGYGWTNCSPLIELFTVYVLKDDLKALWDYRHPGYALRFCQQSYDRAMRSRIVPLKAFARHLKPYVPGILAHCHWPLGTNLIEGINNKIKVIKRMAYGFRDDTYFFLKIRAAFPGIR